MPLSDTTVRTAKPRPKTYKLSDGHGLYLEVVPSGSRYWRLKYRFGGKEKRLALGVYPVVTLAKARADALEARRILHDGVDPAMRKKERERETKLVAAHSFEAVARDWHGVMRPKWTEHHSRNVIESLENDIFPTLGDRPIAELKAPEILDAIRKIERRGAIDIAQRVRQRCSAVFAYAIGSGVAENNPVAAMKGVFLTRRKEPRRMLPASELPSFLRNLRAHKGEKTIQLALHLVVVQFGNREPRKSCNAVGTRAGWQFGRFLDIDRFCDLADVVYFFVALCFPCSRRKFRFESCSWNGGSF